MIIKLRTFIPWLTSALVILFAFEEFIYGRLSMGGVEYLLAKTSSELLLYMLLSLIVMWRMQNDTLYRYRPTPFDFMLLVFIILALVSTLYNGGSLTQGLLNLRTMLRYVAIYYIIVLSAWHVTEWQIRQFLKVILVVVLIQVGVCVVQNIAGDDFTNRYFSAVKSDAEVGYVVITLNSMEQKLGAAIGTFGKTPSLSLFLLTAGVVALSCFILGDVKERQKWFAVYLLVCLGIFLTYKRGPLLLAISAPLLVAWISGHKRLVKRYLIYAVLLLPLLVVALLLSRPTEFVKEKEIEISPLQSISQLFTEEYWNRTNASARGWVIMEVGSEMIYPFKPIGYGADEERAKALLAKKGGSFAKLVGWGALDDVYVIAALVYYGPLGVGLLLLGFYYIYRQAKFLAKHAVGHYQIIGVSFSALLILTFLASFMVRTLEFRAFAFCLWVFAGIVVTLSTRYRQSICDTGLPDTAIAA